MKRDDEGREEKRREEDGGREGEGDGRGRGRGWVEGSDNVSEEVTRLGRGDEDVKDPVVRSDAEVDRLYVSSALLPLPGRLNSTLFY